MLHITDNPMADKMVAAYLALCRLEVAKYTLMTATIAGLDTSELEERYNKAYEAYNKRFDKEQNPS